MSAVYELHFYEPQGTRQFILQGWHRFDYTQRLDNHDYHQLSIVLSPEDDRVTNIRNFPDDGFIQAIRIDQDDNSLTIPYEGFHRTLTETTKKSGEILFDFYGYSYTHLLKRRVVIPPSGQESSDKSGAAETVMKEYIEDSIISPTDTSRQMPGFNNEVDIGQGNLVEYSARYINLFTVIRNLAFEGELHFGVVKNDTIGLFEFQTRAIWGSDRRPGNVANNEPVVFDIDFANIEIPIFSLNSSDERTVVYVGGEGQGVDREIVEVESNAASRTPWNRIEYFLDQRNSTDASLQSLGLESLDDYAKIQKLSFNVIETPTTKWLKDFFLGDLVEARYYGNQSFDKEITKIGVSVTSGSQSQQNEVISVELEDIKF